MNIYERMEEIIRDGEATTKEWDYMSKIRRKRYERRIRKRIELNDGKGLYKVNNYNKEKKILTRLNNKRYRRRKIDLEEIGYKSTQYRKGLYDIQLILY